MKAKNTKYESPFYHGSASSRPPVLAQRTPSPPSSGPFMFKSRQVQRTSSGGIVDIDTLTLIHRGVPRRTSSTTQRTVQQQSQFCRMSECSKGNHREVPEKKDRYLAILQGRILIFGLLLLVGSSIWLLKLSDDYISGTVHDTFLYRELSRVMESAHARTCPSPETHTSWPLANCDVATPGQDTFTNLGRVVVGQSRTSSLTCGFCQQNKFTSYLARLSKITQSYLADKCSMIIYSVKFGKMTKPLYKRFNLTVSQNTSGVNECLLLFMLGADSDDRFDRGEFYPVMPGSEDYLLSSKTERWALRVPVPKNVLPYKNNRRNVKLVKMHGFQIFSWADRVLWLDGKFRQELTFDKFESYYRETITDKEVCASFVGLPSDMATMGADYNRFSAPTFRGHCQAILAATAGRPTVTDSTGAIAQQCESYLRTVTEMDRTIPNVGLRSDSVLWWTSLSLLDYGMIDSAVIAWNSKEPRCRKFMADLSCTWADQIQCYADRDQVSFPYSLFSMGLKVDSGDGVHSPVIWKDNNNLSMVEIVQSTCHWYAAPTFDCVHNATVLASQLAVSK